MKPVSLPRKPPCSRGFTLMEMLLVMVITSVLFSFLFVMLNHSSQMMRHTHRQAKNLQQGQFVLETLSSQLQAVTLSVSPEFFDPQSATFFPAGTTSQRLEIRDYAATSFVAGPSETVLDAPSNRFPGECICWAAPSGMTGQEKLADFSRLLNGHVCFVVHGQDPESVTSRYRYRLVQLNEPAENFKLRLQSQDVNWHRRLLAEVDGSLEPRDAVVLAENVVALLVTPLDGNGQPLDGMNAYDSWAWRRGGDLEEINADAMFNQLPVAVRIGIVSITEPTAEILEARYGTAPPLGSALQGLNAATDWEPQLRAIESTLPFACEFQLFQATVRLPNSSSVGTYLP